jgi:hypothetical protein
MTRKPIEELIIGAARGEPMEIDERRRLVAALAASAELDAERKAQEALSEQLSALRSAIQVPPSPPAHEDALLEAYRAARSRRLSFRKRRSVRFSTLAAAAGVAALTLLAPFIGETPAPTSVASRTAESPAAAEGRAGAAGAELHAESSGAPPPAVFHALPFSPGVSLSGSYSVVRVRIPVSAFPGSFPAVTPSSVEADLLIGEDGIPSAISFINADTVLVSNMEEGR